MTITRTLAAHKKLFAAGCALAGAFAVLAVIVGGLYALDRVDAAADRQAEATRQAAADQMAMQITVQDVLAKQMARHAYDLEQAVADAEQAVADLEQAAADNADHLAEVLYGIDGNRVDNENSRIETVNDNISAANRIVRSIRTDCYGWRVNGVHQQNGCFQLHIAELLPYLIG